MNPALNVAIAAARQAGRLINIAANDLDRIKVENKGPKDFVSEVDRQAEATIIEHIQNKFPHHSILSEESGLCAPLSSRNPPLRGDSRPTLKDDDYQWIIDPLDGTTNFLHGFPQYAVSIALYCQKKAEVAVVFDPIHNELFTALRGKGAMVDQRRLRVSQRYRLSDSLLGTGFSFHALDELPHYLRQIEEMMRHTAGVRQAGAAALDLAYVAAGRLDGFWEFGLSRWDFAAGVLLIREAGGMVTDFDGTQEFVTSGNVMAANTSLHEKLLKSFANIKRDNVANDHESTM